MRVKIKDIIVYHNSIYLLNILLKCISNYVCMYVSINF